MAADITEVIEKVAAEALMNVGEQICSFYMFSLPTASRDDTPL